MKELLDVIKVEARADKILFLVFENQEKKIFDMKPFLDEKPFEHNTREIGKLKLWSKEIVRTKFSSISFIFHKYF